MRRLQLRLECWSRVVVRRHAEAEAEAKVGGARLADVAYDGDEQATDGHAYADKDEGSPKPSVVHLHQHQPGEDVLHDHRRRGADDGHHEAEVELGDGRADGRRRGEADVPEGQPDVPRGADLNHLPRLLVYVPLERRHEAPAPHVVRNGVPREYAQRDADPRHVDLDAARWPRLALPEVDEDVALGGVLGGRWGGGVWVNGGRSSSGIR